MIFNLSIYYWEATGLGKVILSLIFSLIRNIYNQNLQNYIQKKGGADSLLHFGKRHTSVIDLAIYFKSPSDHESRFIIQLEAGQNNLFIKETKTTYEYGEKIEQRYKGNTLELQFRGIKSGDSRYVNDRLKEFEVYHFHDTSDTSSMKAMADIHDNAQLKRDGSNLAAFLYYLKEKEPKNFKRIELTVKSIALFF